MSASVLFFTSSHNDIEVSGRKQVDFCCLDGLEFGFLFLIFLLKKQKPEMLLLG